jgi:histidine ammonia-lyase
MLDPTKESSTENKSNKQSITIGVNCKLRLADLHLLASTSTPVRLSPGSYAAMEASHRFLKTFIDQRKPIYGINTQFGDQVSYLDPFLHDENEALYYESIHQRQENLIRSHSCGLGDIISIKTIKVAMMLRAHCLAQGYSGVSQKVTETVLAHLNAGIIPVVRQYGSIGASGDLIPLAMIAASIIGENVDTHYKGNILKAPKAIEMAGLKKFKPESRDGLAMINGTSFMSAIAGLAVYNLKRLFKQMLSAIAMSLESMLVMNSAYHPLVHQLKNQTGENIINNFLINFWKGSQLLTDLDQLRNDKLMQTSSTFYKNSNHSLQDYYSVRSVSQGFGPFQENLERATKWIENEINSVNDNPIIDVDASNIYHAANFMGYYITDACDILKMNIAQASTWIHGLLANMVHPRKNRNLPANLVENPGVNNGFRPLQLLAASIAVQNRKLAQAQQAFSLPTEGDNQDVNSLGTHAAFDLQESVKNLERLTAILLLASTQALELRGIESAGQQSQLIFHTIRNFSKKISDCRPMSDEIGTIIDLLKSETFIKKGALHETHAFV